MRRNVLCVSLLLFVAFTSATLFAQSHAAFKIQIPMDFVVNDQTYPAGEYTVAQQGTDWETLYGAGGRVVAFAPATLKGQIGSNNLLIFHQLGEKYYLAEMWTAGSGTGRAINVRSLSDRKRDSLVARAVTVVSSGGTTLAMAK